jgi:ABC-type Mn2+/Zn2+ transport system ATPase subunit
MHLAHVALVCLFMLSNQQIVNLPTVVSCDEPTSGLDSSTAVEVMRAVKNLAKMNRTCLATIHQPSPEVRQMQHTSGICMCVFRLFSLYNIYCRDN